MGTLASVHLSVVLPVYQCAPCLQPLFDRLKISLDKITNNWEVIFVDDGSFDDGWSILQNLYKTDDRIVLVKLSRNFGQNAAITAGLAQAKGDWTVVMDCDLQDPPEEISKLYQMAIEGHDVVCTRRSHKRHSLWRRVASYTYSKLISIFSQQQLSHDYGYFSIISRQVRKSFLKVHDLERNYLHMIFWLGFNRGEISYAHQERYAGKSSYSLRALVVHAFSGIFFQTTIFLRLVVYLGFIVAASGMALGLFFVYEYFHGEQYPGWTSLAVLILFIGGATIASIGVCGLYIGLIYDQVKGRPLFVISQKQNHQKTELREVAPLRESI